MAMGFMLPDFAIDFLFGVLPDGACIDNNNVRDFVILRLFHAGRFKESGKDFFVADIGLAAKSLNPIGAPFAELFGKRRNDDILAAEFGAANAVSRLRHIRQRLNDDSAHCPTPFLLDT